MKRAVAYARTSSEAQRDNTSIDDQLQRITYYAEVNNLAIIESIKDEAQSGQTIHRSGLHRLKTLARNNTIEAVCFYDMSRAGRNATETLATVSELEALGIDVHFVTMERRKTATGNFMLGIHAVAAQYYADELGEKSRNGRLYKARVRQQVVGTGWVPFGYSYEKKSGCYTINEEHAPLVRSLFERYAAGDVSLNALCDDLTSRGISTAKGGRFWHSSSLCRILTDTTYIGVTYYNKCRLVRNPDTGRRTTVPRDPSEWIAIPVPAILDDPSLFAAVQTRLRDNKMMSLARRTTIHDYLLQGRVFCQTCVYPYRPGQKRSVGNPHYRFYAEHAHGIAVYKCGGRFNHAPNPCTSIPVRAAWLEPEVWRLVERIVTDPGALSRSAEQLAAVQPVQHATLARIDQALALCDQDEAALLEEVVRKRFSESVIATRLAALHDRRCSLLTERTAVCNQDTAISTAGLVQLVRSLALLAPTLDLSVPLDFAIKRLVIDTLDVQVVLKDAQIASVTLCGYPIALD